MRKNKKLISNLINLFLISIELKDLMEETNNVNDTGFRNT